ncbi:MAG: hypothetical protein ABGZ35_03565 [Planctomycetaceae bacterium]
MANEHSDNLTASLRREFIAGVERGILTEWSLRDYIASREQELLLNLPQRQPPVQPETSNQSARHGQ